jgi:formylglycine-generating enzyme required for sulfatase activity
LPPGITLSGNSGATVSLSGTPTTPGTYNFRVRVSSAGTYSDIDVSYIVESDDSPNLSQMITVVGGTLPLSSELAGQTVATFQIGKYEVTWDEWQEVRTWAVANGYSDLSGIGNGTVGNHPVQSVSWYDVLKWCNAKSEKEGVIPVYSVNGTVYRTGDFGLSGSEIVTMNSSANGYRLTLEKEWEWAARGGGSSGNYTYSGSNDVNEVAWYSINSSDGTNSVGTKAANELAIHDMSGNVFEWCWDLYEDEIDPGYFDGRRLIRGGSWSGSPSAHTVAYRYNSSYPDGRNSNVGFRLARSSGN